MLKIPDKPHQNPIKTFKHLQHRNRSINLNIHFYCLMFCTLRFYDVVFHFTAMIICRKRKKSFHENQNDGATMLWKGKQTHICRTMYFRYDYVFALCAPIYVSGCRQLLCAIFYIRLWLLRRLDALNICI